MSCLCAHDSWQQRLVVAWTIADCTHEHADSCVQVWPLHAAPLPDQKSCQHSPIAGLPRATAPAMGRTRMR